MFLHPIMLAGLAGAMLPLVLHLLGRARYRNVRWGAMMFLDGDPRRRDRRWRYREIILLLIRMGIVALLAIALARPVIGPSAGSTDGPVCTVIILDHSGSMRLEQNGPPRMDMARRAALDVLSNLRRSDETALIVIPETPNEPPLLTADLQLLVERVNALRPVNGRADISAALSTAAELFGKSRASLKHLVLIGDRQASSWTGVTDSLARDWRKSVGDALFTVIPIGGDDDGNITIESVFVTDPPVVAGVPTNIEVHVTNFDSLPCTGVPLTILAGNEELFSTTLNLDARASANVRCPITFETIGSRILRARIDAPGLPADDIMDFAVDVSPPIGVLVVSGDERDSSLGFRGETDFLRLALGPFHAAGMEGADLANIMVVSPEAWPELNRLSHRVLILANIPRILPEQVRQIEQFVFGGGGLLLAPGNLTQIDEYNKQLWRDGSGLLPTEILAPVAADGSESTSLLGVDLSHPILRFLHDRDDPMPRAIIKRYFPTARIPRGKVLGRYASGAPFIVAGNFGRGRVVLITTPLDADWNNLPFSSAYLPLMQSMIRYLAAGTAPEWNLWAREPIVAAIDNPIEPRASVDRGPGLSVPIDLLRIGDSYEARYTDTARPGAYQLRVWTEQGLKQIPFMVRTQRDESDLATFPVERWQTLQRALGFSWTPAESSAIAEAVLSARRRIELWPFLIAVVVGLGILEIVLSRLWIAVLPENQA